MVATLAGSVIGHMLAEYVLQPERLLTYKRATEQGLAWFASAIAHSAIWTLSVWMLSGTCGGEQLTHAQLIACAAGHFVLDCTPVGKWLLQGLDIQSMESAMKLSMEEEMPQLVASVEFALSAASEQMYWLTIHVMLIHAVLGLVP